MKCRHFQAGSAAICQCSCRVMLEIDTSRHAGSWCKGHPEICTSQTCIEPFNPATTATFDLPSVFFKDAMGSEASKRLFRMVIWVRLIGSWGCWSNQTVITFVKVVMGSTRIAESLPRALPIGPSNKDYSGPKVRILVRFLDKRTDI
eukprot:TRINITY_DN11846_c4_g1_i17.p1 TRINITY_DN11846_c4_g1~~TRINITY_DN11846_c4_g1_i17.p1  ORF type:complete len:147 (+),score=0.16 TRINITY_DN11846_c4_g1_i17:265-705(+)